MSALPVQSSSATMVDGGAGTTVTFVSGTGTASTVYYGYGPGVSSTSNAGSLTAGQSVALVGPAWFIAGTAANGSLGSAALAETPTVTPAAAVKGNRVAALGDSITIGNSSADNLTQRSDLLQFASLLSDCRIVYHKNAGVTGNKASDMLARMDADVIATSPDWCLVMSGTNDASNSVTLATYAQNIQAIVAKLNAAGIRPVLMVSPPLPAGTQRTTAAQYANWIRVYAFRNGIPLIDVRNALIDPTTGGYLSAFDSGDGIHPNQAGYKAIGQLIATQLAPLLPPSVPPFANFATGQESNMIPNALGLNGAAPGTSWGKVGSGTVAFVTGDTNIMGNWWRITDTVNEQTTVQVSPTISTGFAVGDRIAFSGRFQSDNTAGTATVFLFFAGSSVTYRPISVMSVTMPNHLFYFECNVPAGSTAIQPGLQVQSGTGLDARIAQPSLVNLTALGLA